MQRNAMYYILRIVMLASSTLWLVAGLLFWVRLDGYPLGVVAASRYGVPLWHLGVPAIGLLTLIALVKEPDGIYRLLAWASIPEFIYMVAVLVSLDEMPGVNITLGSALTFAAFLVYWLASSAMSLREVVVFETSVMPLVNMGRIAHLKSLVRLTDEHGWRLFGPYPPINIVVADGLYRGRALRIESAMTHGGRFTCKVTIRARYVLWPAMIVTRFEPPPQHVIENALYRRTHIRLWPVRAYLWPPEDQEPPEDALAPVLQMVKTNQSLFRGKTAVRSYADGVLFQRTSRMRMNLLAEDLEEISQWLVDFVEMMENSGLCDLESPLNKMVWDWDEDDEEGDDEE